MNPQPFDWRAHLKVHPAAELFPLMSEAELKELAEDIRANGLRTPFVGWSDKDAVVMLLDGRNRLDALAQLGLLYETPDHHIGLKTWTGKKGWADLSGDRISTQYQYRYPDDPYALALSLNVHRRHLTAEQKRDLIAKVLKAKPEQSNRAIAKQVKADDKTVGKVRAGLKSNCGNSAVGKDHRQGRQIAARQQAQGAGEEAEPCISADAGEAESAGQR